MPSGSPVDSAIARYVRYEDNADRALAARCHVWGPADWHDCRSWYYATVRPLAVINDLLAAAGATAALTYATKRLQFGQPLVSFQLIQDKLGSMLAEVTAMQLFCFRLARLIQDGRLTDTIAALAKL